tara:strand:+ start:387 stop:635 length:249 start_codon:yes stop_codon:yes gene_type:complete
MKYKVIKNGYFIIDNLSNSGLLSEEEFNMNFIHMLIIGDIWKFDEVIEGETILKCIKSETWDGESSEGWFNFDLYKDYFELI